MKPRIILTATVAILLAGCGEDKRAAELDQLKKQNAELAEKMAAQEQAALREKQVAAEAEAARIADANRKEAERLATERAAIEVERQRMAQDANATEEQRRIAEEDLRKRVAAAKIAEQNAAEARAKMAADVKRLADERRMEEEKRIAAERKAALMEREQAAARATVERTTDFFYTALDPYGDWDEVEGYGPVFQPREARDKNWRPYTDGEWLWTEQGWTWRSNEPHGWATSHYGRWLKHAREGWMWVPGSEWAPAWVSWRKNDDYIGWAPLPPEAHSGRGFNASVDDYYDIGARRYCFVQRERFGAGRSYVGRIVEPERNAVIIQATVNVTNIGYRTNKNTTVIFNNGPELDFVNARASAPIQTVRLEREEMPDNRANVGPATVTGGLLRLIAPVISHERPVAKPTVIRKTADRNFDRGWSGADEDAVKAFRTKAAGEARQAENEEREQFRKGNAAGKPASQAELPRPAQKATPDPEKKVAPVEPPKLIGKPAPETPKKPEANMKPVPTQSDKPVAPAGRNPEVKKPAANPQKPELKPVDGNAEKPHEPVAMPTPEIAKPPKSNPPAPEPKPGVPGKQPKEVPTQKPVIARPDSAAPKAQAPKEVEKPAEKQPEKAKDGEKGDTKAEDVLRSEILKRKLTPEEKARLKSEAEKALKSLKEKLGN